jgi:hypothetical protein
MRRLYVAPKDVHTAMRENFSTHITTHWLALCVSSDPAVLSAWVAKGSPVVISTEFRSEFAQDRWENHPYVTVLPDPVYSGTDTLTSALAAPENKLNLKWATGVSRNTVSTPLNGGVGDVGETSGMGSTMKQGSEAPEVIDGMECLVTSGLGIEMTDTVIVVHAKLAVVHPAFRLRAIR